MVFPWTYAPLPADQSCRFSDWCTRAHGAAGSLRMLSFLAEHCQGEAGGRTRTTVADRL